MMAVYGANSVGQDEDRHNKSCITGHSPAGRVNRYLSFAEELSWSEDRQALEERFPTKLLRFAPRSLDHPT
jgi:hypothetical protein